MEWDHIRTGKELHEFAIANFEGQPGPYVLMVDEVRGCIAPSNDSLSSFALCDYGVTGGNEGVTGGG